MNFYQDNSFPREIKAIEGMQCSLKLFVTANNVEEKSSKFLATHIIKGFNTEDEMTNYRETTATTETSAMEVFSIIHRINILHNDNN